MMGRTHGVHAEPTTFGLKMALWYEEMKRNRSGFAVQQTASNSVKFPVRSALMRISIRLWNSYVCEKLGISAGADLDANIAT